MNILHRRPLFLCCSIYMLAAVIGFALPTAGTCLFGILLVMGAAILCGFYVRHRHRGRAALAVIACLLACLSLWQSHKTFYGPTITRLNGLVQTAVHAEGTVTDRRSAGGYMTTYTLSLTEVDGVETDGLALLTCHYVSDLQPGHTVTLEATVITLSEAAGDGYDATALAGDGYIIGLLSESEETVTILEEDTNDLRVKGGALRRSMAAKLNLLTGDNAKGLPSALLLGDKSALSDEVRRDFARTGVSHLLAISGLHMTLLFGLLAAFLRLIRVPKRAQAILLGVCALGYLILLGFPPSATRAVIMLGMTYLSTLLSSRADPLTSLGLAGALILAVTPYAVADAGFWMSFLATLGLVTLSPLVSSWFRAGDTGPPSVWRVVLRGAVKLVLSLLVGVTAMSFTLFVVASVIGEVGILSPITTVILTPLCGVVLVTSLVCLPFAGTACGVFLSHLIQVVCSLMTDLAAWMAKPSWIVLSLRHPAVVPITVVMTVALLVLLAVRLPARWRWTAVLPILVGWIAVGGVLAADSLMTNGEVSVTYLQPSSKSDSLVIVSGQAGFVCDLSNGSLSSMTAAVREAEQQGATELAALMLTHYHTRTSGALSTLLARETIRALWLPRPADTEDYYLLLACLEKAEIAGVPVYLYDMAEPLRVFGDGTLTLETAALKRSVQPVLLVSLDVSSEETGKDRLLYCGSAVFESDLAERAAELVASADTVVFGSHGPLIKAPYGDDLDLTHIDTVIFSAYDQAAAWFDPSRLPENVPMWMGQKRFILQAT